MPQTTPTATAPSEPTPAGRSSRLPRLSGPRDSSQVLAFLAPLSLIVYLGLESGGFATIVYSEVGILAWWVVLLGALGAMLPGRSLDRTTWIALAALTAFALWTSAGVIWSDSAERSMIEVGRIATYLGIFVLALRLQTPGSTRSALCGVAAGIALISTLGLLSRLLPDLFPANDLATFLPDTRSRLAFPLNYWNGLAALTAIGLPLVVWLSIGAKSRITKGLCAAVATTMSLTIFFTISRGGAIGALIGVAVLFALHPERIRLLLTAVPIAFGSVVLIVIGSGFDELQDGLDAGIAVDQGVKLLVITAVIAAAVGLLAALIDRAYHAGRIDLPLIDRGIAIKATLAVAVVAVIAFVAFGGPGWASDQFDSFKASADPGVQSDRLQSISGNGRWQYWSSAVDANETNPLVGIGPGTFELWWAQFGTLPGYIRDAHSLVAEVLGELGIVGLALISLFLLTLIVTAVRRTLATFNDEREMLAAAAAAVVVVVFTAAIDWTWELAVVPAAFLFIAAAVLCHRSFGGLPASEAETTTIDPVPGRKRTLLGRAAIAVVALVAAAAIYIPGHGVELVERSQQLTREGDLDAALEKAESAIDLQPYAARPLLQQAGILELMGDLDGAADAAFEATKNDTTDWRTWYTLARLRALREKIGLAVNAYETARDLNPRSVLFFVQPEAAPVVVPAPEVEPEVLPEVAPEP